MDRLRLDVQLRADIGKKILKKIRKNGEIPSVVYGANVQKNIMIKEIDFQKMIKGHSSLGNLIFSLSFENKTDNQYAIIQEIQKNPLTEKILHIDFKAISLKDHIEAKVPVAIKGIPIGVQSGGLIQQHFHEIHIRCLPNDLPEFYKIDVSHLDIGDFLQVSDLKAVKDIVIIQNPEDMILAVVASKVFDKEPEEEEAPQEPEVINQKKEKAEE